MDICSTTVLIATKPIARARLMGRKKLTSVRRVAQEFGWLNPGQPLPEDTVIAGQTSSAKASAREGRYAR
jgi:hypothetical protein